MRVKRWVAAAVLTSMLSMAPVIQSNAEIAGAEAFQNIAWTSVHEEARNGGIVQSIVSTEDYIITIENVADDSAQMDIVTSYYRNDTDADGNPVEKYSQVKRVQDHEWEHCNGMAYNPKTKEIYVALYTNLIEENRGCLYVMDPETLEYTRSIKVSDDYNILGIDYMEDKDQYVILTNVDGGYSLKVLDANFQVVDDLGQFADTSQGGNFQDLTVSGDYIMVFPLTLNLGIGDFINVYSLSERKMITQESLNWSFDETVVSDEPESLCKIGDGELLSVVNYSTTDGTGYSRFYEAQLPYNYYITSEVSENGKVSGIPEKVLKGEDYAFKYSPEKKYMLTSVKVDGKEQAVPELTRKEMRAGKNSGMYTIKNVQSDQKIEITFEKMPFDFGRLFMVLGIILATIALAFFVLYMYVRIVVRERRRRERARRRRRQREREEALRRYEEEHIHDEYELD